MTRTLKQLDALVSACMENECPDVQERHRGAGACARQLEATGRIYHRGAEARALLDALELHEYHADDQQRPPLTTAELLQAAAILAARASDDELELGRRELEEAGDGLAECLEGALETHIYEPGDVPDDAPELRALEAWRRARGPASAGEQLTVTHGDPLRHVVIADEYEEEPEEARTGTYRVRFYKATTTADRHTIVVRASSPEAARERVNAWGEGKLELTPEEEESENLEKEGEITDSAFSELEEQDHAYAVVAVNEEELA
jgi:hypothetical protein